MPFWPGSSLPFAPGENLRRYASAPRQAIHLFDRTEEGSLIWRPHLLGLQSQIDTATRKRTYVVDPEKKHDIALFAAVELYQPIGIIPMRHKLPAPEKAGATFSRASSTARGCP